MLLHVYCALLQTSTNCKFYIPASLPVVFGYVLCHVHYACTVGLCKVIMPTCPNDFLSCPFLIFFVHGYFACVLILMLLCVLLHMLIGFVKNVIVVI